MKKKWVALMTAVCLTAVPVGALAADTDYSFLEDMSVKQLRELDAAIHNLLGDGGAAQEESSDQTYNTEGVYLNELEYFEKDDWFSVTSGGEDSYGNSFHYQLYMSAGIFDTTKKSITYYLGGKYSSLTGELFIPKYVNSSSSGYNYNWDTATFTIYSIDKNDQQKTLYKKDDFSNKMKPEKVTVDLSGAEFLKIEFLDALYNDSGSTDPLVAFGDAMLY